MFNVYLYFVAKDLEYTIYYLVKNVEVLRTLISFTFCCDVVMT